MLTPLSEERYQRQKDELQALESIFGDDIVSAKIQNCWKQPCPLEITINLKPPFVDEIFVSLELEIVCSSSYPEQSPTFLFHNPVQLSQKDLEELRSLLVKNLRKTLEWFVICLKFWSKWRCEFEVAAGQVSGSETEVEQKFGNSSDGAKYREVIYELCQTTQEFLAGMNRKPVSSMHEMMLKEKAKKEIEQKKERADSETREIAAIDDENERRREELLNKKEQEELERRNRMQMANLGKELGDCIMVDLLSSGLDKQQEKKRIYKLLKIRSFRPAIHSMSVEWCAWSHFCDQILVTEWVFQYTLGRKGQRKTAVNPDFSAFEDRLDQFLQLVHRLLHSLKVDDQQFFTNYLFVNLNKLSTSPTNFNCRILIGQNVEAGDTCLGNASTMEIVKANTHRLVPQLAAQMVCAFKWLHAQNFSHGNFDQYSVWLTNNKMFRMSDYFLLPYLKELCNEFDRLTNPASHTLQMERGSLIKQQRRDLFCLGKLLDSILGPKDILKCDQSESPNCSPSNPDAVDFIKACQTAKNIEQLAEHNYLIQDFRQPSNMSFDSNPIPGVGSLVDSRLAKEFQVVQWLGKGGFGDVYLARNKVDDNDYAVKRIPLNPKSERLNQKIKREAKLFSKLNHEHVVRYYSAWIESIPDVQDGSSSKSSSLLTSTSPITNSSLADGKLKAAEKGRLAPLPEHGCNVGGEWSESFQQVDSSASSTDDESWTKAAKKYESKKDEAKSGAKNVRPEFSIQPQQAQNVQTLFSPRMANPSKSTAGHSEFDVVFGEEDESDDEDLAQEGKFPPTEESVFSKAASKTTDERSESTSGLHQILYIQMEYCKNSTLRTLIDTGRLHSDTSMIWRLFREILSGLQYIHHQNMIHRDIKPMNILLDGNYSVKIGDFGLATRDLIVGQPTVDTGNEPGRSGSIPSEFTKNVGTMFYIAPELQSGGQEGKRESGAVAKVYSTKIDVYSVGIVLFEMFLEPPATATERFIILQNLRTRLEFPQNFGSKITQQHRNKAQKVIGQMLKTNPHERPSVDGLLQSDEIPLVTYEEDEFQKMFAQTLKKRKSRLYRWMVDSMFNQTYDSALDHCFDQKICEELQNSTKEILMVEKIKRELQNIFELHAFVPLPTHLLVPLQSHTLDVADDASKDELKLIATQQPCTLLHSSGLAVNLPVNLRQSFVRYCARNSVTSLKRYAFGQLYSPADSPSDHPAQRNECCVDSVGPIKQKSMLAAEVIYLSIELTRKLSCLAGLRLSVCIGHAKIIQSACVHLGMGDKTTMFKVFNTLYFFTLAQNRKKLTHDRKCIHLVNRCGITQQMANSLLKLLETTKDFDDFSDQLRPLIRSKTGQVRDLSREGMDDVTKVLDSLQCFNSENSQHIIFDPALAYRPTTFSNGLAFLVKVELVGQNTAKSGIVMAGGSYEWCIEAERNAQEQANATAIYAIGFNLPLENLANFHLKQSLDGTAQTCFALVCCTSAGLDKERCDLVRKLWNFNVSADILHQPISSEAQIYSKLELCRQNAISFLLLLMERDEVLVHADESLPVSSLPSSSRSYSSYRIAHKRVSCDEAVKIVVANAGEEYSNCAVSSLHQPLPPRGIGETAFVSDIGSASGSGTSAVANSLANVNINFAMDDKPPHNTRKKNEMQVRNTLSDLFSKLTPKTRVEVFVTDLLPDILRQLSSLLDRRFNQTEFRQAFDVIFKQAGKQKSDVDSLLHSLSPFFTTSSGFSTASSVLILWSRPVESFYRVIV